MKFKRQLTLGILAAVAVFAMTGPAMAISSITTMFASDNFHDGNMFDLTTFGSSITVRSLAVNVSGLGAFGVDVYIKNGSYSGSETNAGAWTLVSTHDGILSAGIDDPTFIDVSDFMLAGNNTFGVYITVRPTGSGEPRMRYTNGGGSFSNADLQLDLGAGIGGDFGSLGVFGARTWNGTINYDVNPVPEPGTMALFGLGLAGVATWRRRRSK